MIEQDLQLEYKQYILELQQTLYRIVYTLYGCVFLSSFSFINLLWFTRNGQSPVHPVVTILALLATVLLMIVVLVSFTNTRQCLNNAMHEIIKQ